MRASRLAVAAAIVAASLLAHGLALATPPPSGCGESMAAGVCQFDHGPNGTHLARISLTASIYGQLRLIAPDGKEIASCAVALGGTCTGVGFWIGDYGRYTCVAVGLLDGAYRCDVT